MTWDLAQTEIRLCPSLVNDMLLAAALLLLCSPVNTLHYYTDAGQSKCFTEDLPVATHMIGALQVMFWDSTAGEFITKIDTITLVTVTTGGINTLLSTSLGDKGTFRFTSADSGVHAICVKPSVPGWFTGRIKVFFDLQFGDVLNSTGGTDDKRSRYKEIQDQLKAAKEQVTIIRNEFVRQRDREGEYRSASEVVNTGAISWSVVQMIVLGLTCLWQLRQLKSFFVAKKLV